MRRNTILRTSVALAAVTALLGACSDDGADPDSKAEQSSSSATDPDPTDVTSPVADDNAAPTDEADLPDGVLPLPQRAPGESSVALPAGRYHVPLTDTLAFEVDVPPDSTAHDDGLFIATESFVLKTEAAHDAYGVPDQPCTSQVIKPAGPTVEDLVAAMTDLPIYEMSRPERVVLGGAEGFYVEARVPRDYDASECEGEAVQLPSNPASAVSGPPPYIGRWWVLDVDGQRVVVQQNCWGCSVQAFDNAPRMFETIAFTPTS